ncbi:ABC transporter ATP-binding protein [Pyrococcus furiosus DSM 3638]|uniref:ABC transporter (MsbA subfamily) n=3 Tax=Pyrococcus furiosus TaxID=2261 RepID=Q8U2T6_PYRFU|nr:ABC transporter ATP-binding protein [Pyrococcus furiosus]AAL80868.1 ABC transporter (msbA subfamily) [Pyrococcus furiosus DSM 3638]AFN03535.1 ABC transporter [Pyrococcus furiosus COM1]QEK78432.1 ABC transporter ATP-binding protein [Pyrococcus furiosus DSM 3638]
MSILTYSLRRYWQLSKKLRKRQMGIIILNTVVSFLEIKFALTIRNTINNPETGKIILLMVIFALINVLGFIVSYNLEISKRIMQVELIGRIYEKILHAKESAFKKKTPGEYLTDLMSNVVYVSFLAAALIPALVVNIVRFCAYLISLIMLSPELFMITLPLLVVFVLIFKKQMREMARLSSMEREKFSMLIERIRNKLEGRKTIKNLNALNGAKKKLNEEALNWYHSIRSLVFASKKYGYLYETLSQIIPLAAILIGLFWRIDVGTLVAFYIVSRDILEPLVVILSDLGYIPEAYPALKRIEEALSLEEEQFGNEILTKVESIEIQDVSYNGILENISLLIKRGETIGIVGESGSGKSTLANIIAGYYRPKKGNILINKIPIFNFKNLRDRVKLVESHEFIFPGTVKENITLWEDFSEEDIKNILKTVQLNIPLEEKIGPGYREVSLGERQRIALARALLRKPEVLILDEALSGVDPDMEAEIINEIKAKGITLIVISHRPSTINLVDKVIFIENGKVKMIKNLRLPSS